MGKQFIMGTLYDVVGPNDPEVDRAWISVQRVEAYAGRELAPHETSDLLARFAWDELAGYPLLDKHASDLGLQLSKSPPSIDLPEPL